MALRRTTLNEAELNGLTGTAGWVGHSPSLTAGELETLISIMGHRLPEAQRPKLAVWLDRLFAQLVVGLQKREQTRSKVEQRNQWNRKRCGALGKNAAKLSTLVFKEVDRLEGDVTRLVRIIDDLSQSARSAINCYLQRNGLEDHTSGDVDRTCWRTWGRMDEALLYIQLACERADDTGGRLPREVRAELIRVDRAIGTLRARLDGMSDPCREALELSFFAHFERRIAFSRLGSTPVLFPSRN